MPSRSTRGECRARRARPPSTRSTGGRPSPFVPGPPLAGLGRVRRLHRRRRLHGTVDRPLPEARPSRRSTSRSWSRVGRRGCLGPQRRLRDDRARHEPPPPRRASRGRARPAPRTRRSRNRSWRWASSAPSTRSTPSSSSTASSRFATNPGQLWRLERDYEAAERWAPSTTSSCSTPTGPRSDRRLADRSGSAQGGVAARSSTRTSWRAAWRAWCAEQGVTIHERTPALEIEPAAATPRVVTPNGAVTADQVVVATNAYQHALRAVPQQGDPGLELRDGDRAAQRRAARPGRVARPRGVRGQAQLHNDRPADRRQPRAVGRPARPLLLQQRHGHCATCATRACTESCARRSSVLPDVEGRSLHACVRAAASRSPASFVPCFGRLDGGVVYGYGYNGHGVAPSHTGGKILRDLVLGATASTRACSSSTGGSASFPPEPLRLRRRAPDRAVAGAPGPPLRSRQGPGRDGPADPASA